MDRDYESLIVKAFFDRSYQDRIRYELASPKKRQDAIGRLSHHYQDVLNTSLMHPVNCSDAAEIRDILISHQASVEAYVISFNAEVDGSYLPLGEALASTVHFGMPSLVVCSLNLAYFEGEQGFGPPPRYILKR